jgi:hypothetical protein
MADRLDSALDRLYGVPLDDFTTTRNALAKELTGDDAKTVKALKKPSIAAWALNQLARGNDLDGLFEATDKLRRAQRRVMSGGKASELRAATDERNAVVSALTKRVREILGPAGYAASASTLSAVRDTLIAVASDDVGAELLRKGRLTRELHPRSVVDVGGLTLVGSPDDDDEPLADLGSARDAVEAARKRVKEAQSAVSGSNREAERLAHEADRAERAAKAARESAEFAKRAAEARKAELDEAESDLAEAHEVLRKARRS